MANIRVAVRARPLLPSSTRTFLPSSLAISSIIMFGHVVHHLTLREMESQSPVVVDMRGQATILFKSEAGVAAGEMRDASKEFVYDHSYWSVNKDDPHFANQDQIFGDLGQYILKSAFEGYNGCVFAYGQTGSGKTYTMMGNENSPGLIPRICQGLFEGIKKDPNQVSHKVEVSYMEIYNEKVRDLLKVSLNKANSPQHNLKVREHPKEGPYVENLSKCQVSDYQAIEEVITIGNCHRVTAATKMNDVSSRSHAIFTINFVQAKYSHGIPSETVSKIHLVDLAGSERASQTGAEGQRLKEGGSINKSLVCLGNVIQALADISSGIGRSAAKQKGRYIPYRDSVLTWLLKDSLGGNSKTVMIATVSPCQYSYAETLSTLRYASRAKNIVNKPKVNEDENVKIIRELREEIRRLKSIIGDTDKESSLRLAVDLHNKEERIASLTRNWAEKWDSIQKIIEERDLALRSEGVKMTVESEQPHLLGVDEDKFSAGVVLYYLKDGDTTIGHENAPLQNDISFKSEGITETHCKIVLTEDGVYLHKIDGPTLVNQVPVELDQPVRLVHGDTLKLGSNTYLRFNHPEEASRLRESLIEPNSSRGSFASSVWSPLLNHTSSSSSIQSDKLLQLEQERDELRRRQEAIEQEYEDKIRSVQEQLKKEEQDKAELLRELDRLREEKLNASITLSSTFSMSTPYSSNVPHSTYRIPVNFSPTPSESDTSISYDQREVTGGECPDNQRTSSPMLLRDKEDYPHDIMRQRRNTVTGSSVMGDKDDVHEFTVSLRDNGDIDVSNADHRPLGENGEDYCLLETDGPKGSSSESGDSQSHELEMLRFIAQQEKDELREEYESKLRREKSVKRRMESEILELEYKLQMSTQEQKKSRTRSNAFTTSTSDLDRTLPQYHSHRESRIKLSVPNFHLRGIGFSSYHVFQIELSVGREQWSVYRRYEQFKNFHSDMCKQYPEVSSLSLPPSKWFGYKNEAFVAERKVQLERYLKAFLAIITSVSSCILSEVKGKKMSMDILKEFHPFFRTGVLEGDL